MTEQRKPDNFLLHSASSFPYIREGPDQNDRATVSSSCSSATNFIYAELPPSPIQSSTRATHQACITPPTNRPDPPQQQDSGSTANGKRSSTRCCVCIPAARMQQQICLCILLAWGRLDVGGTLWWWRHRHSWLEHMAVALQVVDDQQPGARGNLHFPQRTVDVPHQTSLSFHAIAGSSGSIANIRSGSSH